MDSRASFYEMQLLIAHAAAAQPLIIPNSSSYHAFMLPMPWWIEFLH